MPPVSFTLGNFMGGALEERFAGELARVLDNVRDPNVPALGKRKITVEFVLDPNEDREVGDIDVSVKSKGNAQKTLKARMFITKDRDGNPAIVTENPQQKKMFDGPVAVADFAKP
jgi:hypothetical protein